MQDELQLDSYLARIDYRGPLAPDISTLAALQAAHVDAIPFEALDPLLGRPVHVDLPSVQQKLVLSRRGGYCFEQNSLLLAALGALGFQACPLSARVRIDRPREATPARTHLFVRVDLGGETWLTDVGVGALSLTRALRFGVEGEQPTLHEPRRLVHEDGRWFHQARLGDTWSDVYEFTGEEMPPIDREVANWFTSTHPQSHFRGRLIAARAAPEGRRITLQDAVLKVRERDGRAVVRTLASADELLKVLRESFGLEFPPGTRFGPPGSPWPQ